MNPNLAQAYANQGVDRANC
ncbi:hypothetical protein [Nostoc sp.]